MNLFEVIFIALIISIALSIILTYLKKFFLRKANDCKKCSSCNELCKVKEDIKKT